MAEGGNLRKAESDIFDVLEAHKRERADGQSSAEALQSQHDRRAQAHGCSELFAQKRIDFLIFELLKSH